MHYGEIKNCDIANGRGVRVSLFVSGCRHHCKNCFNQMTWAFDYGKEYNSDIENKILNLLSFEYIEGLSILGGEPFEPENQSTILDLVKRVRITYPAKTIWIYSGFTYEEIVGLNSSRAFTDISQEILAYIDVLVDGEFIESEKDISLQFRGSKNQRIIDVQETLNKKEIISYSL